MRVTNAMVFRTALANIQKQNARLMQAQEEATSGKKVRHPSDGATDTRRILSARATLASLEQFKRNRSTLTTLLGTTDTALQDIGNLLERAKELTVQAANDTLDRNARAFIADEVAQLFAQAVQTGNTNVGGRHIFAGRQTDQTPFAPLIAIENTASGLRTSGTLVPVKAGDLTINGTPIRRPLTSDDTLSPSDNAASAHALANVINEAAPVTGVHAQASTTLSLTATAFGDLGAGEFTINGQQVTGTITDTASLVAAVKAANIPGIFVSSTGSGNLTITATDGRNIRLQTSGAVAGMNFAEFDLSGGTLDQTTTGTVKLYSDAPFTLGGTNPMQAGFSAGAVDHVLGGRFTGDSGTIELAMSAGQNLAANTVGSAFLVADLRPNLDVDTPLASLHHGQGISPGSITITDRAGGTATIDLSTATTVGDVLSAISGAAGLNVTATVNAAGDGITIVDDNASPRRNLTIQDLGNGTTANDLGIAADRPGNIIGTPLMPRLTPSTPVRLLHGGWGVKLGTIHVANGATEADVDLSSAQTIGDILAALNGSGTNVTANINVTGTALEVRSNDFTTVAIVTDVNGGTTATDLGIQGSNDILKTLSLLQDALEQNDQQALNQLLLHIDQGIDRVSALRADVGARMNRVELVDNNQSELELTVTSMLSQAEDADVLAAFSRLSNFTTALQAALAATAHTVQLSLLDFLR